MLKILIVVQIFSVCFAFPGYRSLIPNGMNVPNPCPNGSGIWNGVGHNRKAGAGPRNVFGVAFKSADKTWTKDLCQADSDTDGKTNGQELGDPNCTWEKGMPIPGNATGHPGVCEPMTDAKCKEINKDIKCDSFLEIYLP